MYSRLNPIVRMFLLLVILKVKSYGSQGQIFLVAVPSVIREESYGAYGSLACGCQSQILWVSRSNLARGYTIIFQE